MIKMLFFVATAPGEAAGDRDQGEAPWVWERVRRRVGLLGAVDEVDGPEGDEGPERLDGRGPPGRWVPLCPDVPRALLLALLSPPPSPGR